MKKLSLNVDSPTSETNKTPIPFYLIRNQYFPTEMEYTDFSIKKNMEDVFNIFIKLSPSMISTMTKAEKRILLFQGMLNSEDVTEDMLASELHSINNVLKELTKVSHVMIEKMEEVMMINDNSIPQGECKLDPDVVYAYTKSVNALVDLTNKHSAINLQTHNILAKKYPKMVEPFLVIAGKVTYVFFINLISYSNKIDKNITAYK